VSLEKNSYKFIKQIGKGGFAKVYLAKTSCRLKDFKNAKKYHKKALKFNKEDIYALRGMGDIFLITENLGKSFNYYNKALDINPSDRVSDYKIGLIHLLSEKYDSAEKYYKDLIDKYKHFPASYFGLGLSYFKQFRHDEAFEMFHKGLRFLQKDNLVLDKRGLEELKLDFSFKDKLDYKDFNILLSQFHFCSGKSHSSSGNLHKAIEKLEESIKFQPSFIEAYILLGDLYSKVGNFASALKNYEKSVELDCDNIDVERKICLLRKTLTPEDFKTLNRLEFIYYLKEDPKKEIEILEKIVKLSPETEDFYKLSCAYLAANERNKAEEIITRLFAIDKKGNLAHMASALLFAAKKDYLGALSRVDKALQIEEKSDTYIKAGDYYGEIGDHEKALDSYFKAFKLSPFSRIAQKKYISCLTFIKDFENSFKIISKYSSLTGYNILQSLLHIRKGEYKKGEKYLKQLKSSEDSEDILHLYLGICYLGQDYFENAIEEFQNSLLSEEIKGEAYVLMAMCYQELQKSFQAINMARKALNFVRFIDPPMSYRFCVLMWELGLVDELKKFVSKAIKNIISHNYFWSDEEKEEILKELKTIRQKIFKAEAKRDMIQEEELGKIHSEGEKVNYLVKKTDISVEKASETLKETKGDIKKAITKIQREKPDKKLVKRDEKFPLSPVDLISVEVGRSLISLIDPNQRGKLYDSLTSIKRRISTEIGLIIPEIIFRDNLQLEPNKYIIKIKDLEVANGEVILNSFLAIGPEKNLKQLKGAKCVDPTYGMPAKWISSEKRSDAAKIGCIIFDAVSVMATQLAETVRCYASEFLGRQEVADLLDEIKKTHPALVNEIYPGSFNLGEIQKVLQNLVREKISIRDLISILETLGDYSHIARDTDILTEFVRKNLSHIICREYQNINGVISAITIDSDLEEIIAGSVKKTDYESLLKLDTKTTLVILSTIGEQIQPLIDKGLQPILLCSPKIRSHMKKFTEKPYADLVVLSYDEIAPKVHVDSMGTVKLSDDLTRKLKKRNIFSYINKMWKDSDPLVRCEALRSLKSLAEEDNLKRVYYYLDRGMKDTDKKVRLETARIIRELCDKNLYF